jgi:GntR family transcriptional regulator
MEFRSDHRADLSRSGVSRYIQLATLFRRRIDSGQWPVGSQIPTIETLAEECGVARATIRQALGLLEAEHLISRFRAKGTFVNRRNEDQLWLDVMTDWRGLLNSREGATIEILEDGVVTSLPERLHEVGSPTSAYRRLRRRHSRGNAAFLVAEVFIDTDLAPFIPPEALKTTTAMRLTSYLPGSVGEAQQSVAIGTADMDTAALLDIPLNAPVCLVDRSVADKRGRLILLSRGIYRGDVVRMDMRLK